MSRIALLGLMLALTMTMTAACGGDDDGVSIDATGTVLGLVWLDRNGNARLDGTDGPVREVRVQLVPAAGGSTGGSVAYSAEAVEGGEFAIRDVLVGDYRVLVDEQTVGDTLRVLLIDSTHVTVEAGDTSVVTVGLTYPAVPIDSARIRPLDTRLFVEGLVLTRWGTFGEASLHVRDSTGAIQAVRVQQANVVPGDSVRVLGITSVQTGQPVIKDASLFLLRTGVESPPPDTVNTATAATAGGGALDADLIHLDSAVVRDTTRNAAGEFVFIVDDGSGPVRVVLDGQIQFSFQFDEVIGTILDVTGVLVPSAPGGAWVVKPRSNTDVVVGELSWETLDIAAARDEPEDTRVIVYGIALNGWTTFGDSTVHVRDGTGAIRTVRVPQSSIATGDSIRVVGTLGSRSGQPVLTKILANILDAGAATPAASTVVTLTAATAGGGARDADLVRIAGAEVQDTSWTAAGDLTLTVDDGSGPVDVVLDRDIAFGNPFPVEGGQARVIGAEMDATGLLVPSTTATGTWILKPRQSADVSAR